VGEGPDLAQFDFPSDEKATKRKARIMLQMVHAINQEHLSKLSDIEERASPALEVTCMTCHRRQSRPVMLQDLLAERIKTDGIDAAEGKYRELREEYYGGFSYDFSAGALTGLGERLGKEGNFESAIRFINIEIELNGESSSVYYTLGGIQASADLVEDAIESFSKGMEMAPDGWKPFFQRELDQLMKKDK
jgi:tetratricopeptide (TPR) repeat protein